MRLPTEKVMVIVMLILTWRLVGNEIFLANVKEHAPPLAGAHVETGVEVHTSGDVDDKAASGGCCVSSCCASSFVLRGHVDESGKPTLSFMQDLFLSPRMDKYFKLPKDELPHP